MICDFCGDHPAVVSTEDGPGPRGVWFACQPCTDEHAAAGGDISQDVRL